MTFNIYHIDSVIYYIFHGITCFLLWHLRNKTRDHFASLSLYVSLPGHAMLLLTMHVFFEYVVGDVFLHDLLK